MAANVSAMKPLEQGSHPMARPYCCESWLAARRPLAASGFISATVRPNDFPLRYAHSSRAKIAGPSGRPLRCRPYGVRLARSSPDRITQGRAIGRDLQPQGAFIMANIGNFAAQDKGYTGTVRTLTLNVKVKIVPTDKDSEKAPDFRILAGNFEIGAAWRKVSQQDRPYLSVTLDDPSFPATIYARLIEGEEGNFDLIWSRPSKAH